MPQQEAAFAFAVEEEVFEAAAFVVAALFAAALFAALFAALCAALCAALFAAVLFAAAAALFAAAAAAATNRGLGGCTQGVAPPDSSLDTYPTAGSAP